VSRLRERYDAFDRFQRRHAWLGFPLAVRQKYGDDQGGYLAATITYYGFFSLFPLLLVFVTLLGYVLTALFETAPTEADERALAQRLRIQERA
jgi:uncharacterized BrkB/YihY/UPF0761 family membrane protein